MYATGITQGVMVSSNDSGPDERELETKSMIESEKTRSGDSHVTINILSCDLIQVQVSIPDAAWNED